MVSIGSDLDSRNGLNLLINYIRACSFGVARVYHTRHGFHVEIEREGLLDYDSVLRVRHSLGDDPARLDVDERRVLSGETRRFDTLFEGRAKGGHRVTRVEFDPVRSVSLPRAPVDSWVGGAPVGGEEEEGGYCD